MKKKNLNAKLQLNKKTIAQLNENAMQEIQGGASLPQCINLNTSPVVCRVVPVTTTRTILTTITASYAGCPTDTSGTSTSVINPGGSIQQG